MALLDCPATQEELFGFEPQFDAPLESDWTQPAEPDVDGHSSDAARGILLAAGLGSLVWAAILWALL
jgi:hypothetical protein